MVTSPLVSVGIPTYNNPEGLTRTLACITGQSYKNLELIISINPTPNPETNREIMEICRAARETDPRIHWYLQLNNIGVDENFRFVLDHAIGDYFMFAQDDDWWSSQYIECLVNALDTKESAPVAATPAKYATGNGTSRTYDLQSVSVYNTIGNGEMGLVCMGLWRRDAHRNCEVRLPIYVLGGDHITVAHAILAYGNPAIIPSELYVKGYKPGRFQVCFNNDFWYSFRSWYWMMKTLAKSPHIPKHRKLLLPGIAVTNLARACAITGVQVIVGMPDNPVKQFVQERFFGTN